VQRAVRHDEEVVEAVGPRRRQRSEARRRDEALEIGLEDGGRLDRRRQRPVTRLHEQCS